MKREQVNFIDTIALYYRDCLFDKQCGLSLVLTKAANGTEHIKTQCSRCGYQTGGCVSKKLIPPNTKIKAFSQRLYNAVYRKKLEEVYGMSGDLPEVNKRLQQIKKALAQGRIKIQVTSKGRRPRKSAVTQQ